MAISIAATIPHVPTMLMHLSFSVITLSMVMGLIYFAMKEADEGFAPPPRLKYQHMSNNATCSPPSSAPLYMVPPPLSRIEDPSPPLSAVAALAATADYFGKGLFGYCPRPGNAVIEFGPLE